MIDWKAVQEKYNQALLLQEEARKAHAEEMERRRQAEYEKELAEAEASLTKILSMIEEPFVWSQRGCDTRFWVSQHESDQIAVRVRDTLRARGFDCSVTWNQTRRKFELELDFDWLQGSEQKVEALAKKYAWQRLWRWLKELFSNPFRH